MIKLNPIRDTDHLLKLWPRLLAIVRDDNENITAESLLQIYTQCLRNGVVFAVQGDHGLMGALSAEAVTNKILVLHTIPQGNGTGTSAECIEQLNEWGKARGYTTIKVTTTRLTGRSYKYFEKRLGFHRHAVTFQRQID